MPADEFGNYQPGLKDNVDFVTPQSGTPVQVGSGAPDASTPVSPLYLDSATGTLYANPTLTAGAWVVAGGGGAVQVYSGSYADPNVAGLVPDDPTKAAIWYQSPTTTVYNIWEWDIAAANWKQFSAPA